MKKYQQGLFSTTLNAAPPAAAGSLTASTRRTRILLLLLVLLCLQSKRVTIATGYKPDPTHRYEHKQDIEKLLHPNQEVHTVQYPPQDEAKRRQQEESYFDDTNFGSPFPKEKAMMNAGFKTTGYVQKEGTSKTCASNMPFMHSMLVTNILDVSAAVERESVVTKDAAAEKN